MEQNQQEAYKTKHIYRSEEQIEKCLDDQAQSGLSILAYCKAKVMCANNFYRWTKKYRGRNIKPRKNIQEAEASFTKIEVFQGDAADQLPSLFAEIGNLRLYKEVPVEYLKALQLGMFLHDGMLLMDTNLIENAIRPIALSRNNFCSPAHTMQHRPGNNLLTTGHLQAA